MAFQKKSLTPEKMEQTAGGWWENLKCVTVADSSTADSSIDWKSIYGYTVYDNDSNLPIAVVNHGTLAKEVDHYWHASGPVWVGGRVGEEEFTRKPKKNPNDIRRLLREMINTSPFYTDNSVIFLNKAQQKQMGPYGSRFATITK